MKSRSNSDSEPVIAVSDERLADIVRALLLNPSAVGEDMTPDTFKMFRGAIAEVVADYFGGEVLYLDDGIAARPNDCSPDGGGIWAATIPVQMPDRVSSIVGQVMNAVARDDTGSFMINQEAIGSLNQLSATVGAGAILLDGQLEPGVEVTGFPRVDWDETCEYYEWVDSCLRSQYESIAAEFGILPAAPERGPEF